MIEDGLVLSISALRRDGFLRRGWASGSLTWSTTHSKRRVADIGFERRIGEEEGALRLVYVSTIAGEKRRSDYTIDMLATPQPFGGRRWWFRCPITGARCAKLYLASGSTKFAARTAYRRLAYRSQRAAPFDRACERAWDLRHKLGDRHGALGDWIAKPRGMHKRTFEKKLARVRQAEAQADALLLRRFRRLAPGDPLHKML